ncbi:Os12g0215700 [Oryza sativa Japonica Group]|uniref:Os12g0215700 protein n=1 Tax=Oryza sativa subsp. japonica TaxID=39947 RepID=A0A0P0Y824_ORYSJ|nr:Os12g0215700 [Oryza sativa Japonica Group]
MRCHGSPPMCLMGSVLANRSPDDADDEHLRFGSAERSARRKCRPMNTMMYLLPDKHRMRGALEESVLAHFAARDRVNALLCLGSQNRRDRRPLTAPIDDLAHKL